MNEKRTSRILSISIHKFWWDENFSFAFHFILCIFLFLKRKCLHFSTAIARVPVEQRVTLIILISVRFVSVVSSRSHPVFSWRCEITRKIFHPSDCNARIQIRMHGRVRMFAFISFYFAANEWIQFAYVRRYPISIISFDGFR